MLVKAKTPIVMLRRIATHNGQRQTRSLEVAKDRHIAYRQVPGQRQPTIIMIPGLHTYSHMGGMAANVLMRFCDRNKFPCIIYDHECTGNSNSGNIKQLLFSHWVEDAIEVVRQLSEGPVILFGPSMGGWLSILAAKAVPDRIHGLVLFAPAINYAYPYYQRHRQQLPTDIRRRLDKGDIHIVNHIFGNALLKKDFAENSRKFELDLSCTTNQIDIDCPVRIIHGMLDTEVLPDQTWKLAQALSGTDVDILYRKSSKHQLEALVDIEMVLNTLDRFIKDHPVRTS